MDDKEQLKKEVSAILSISEKYDLREQSNIKRIRTYYETNVKLTTSVGKKYLERLHALEAGETDCSCIICRTNLADDGVICSSCMNKLSFGKRSIYCNREKNEPSSDCNNDREEDIVKDRSENQINNKGVKGGNLPKAITGGVAAVLVCVSFFVGKYVGESNSNKNADRMDGNYANTQEYASVSAKDEKNDNARTIIENYSTNNSKNNSISMDNGITNGQVDYYDSYDYGEENYDADDDGVGQQYNSGEIVTGYIFPDIIDSGGTLEDFELDYYSSASGNVDLEEAIDIVSHYYLPSDGWYVINTQEITEKKMNFWTAIGYEQDEPSRVSGDYEHWNWDEAMENVPCFYITMQHDNLYEGNWGFVFFKVNTDGRVLASGNIFQDFRYTNGYYRIR